ncbi:MAG: Uncharacterised protein [Synechococcus sp. CC9902]|nr:MAG: Uncharacterised protein [Synechococcus sp. CC9902]
MGHNPLEIALHRHLLHQGPAFIRVALEPKRPLEHTAVPSQAIGRLNLERTLQEHISVSGLEHRLNTCIQRFGPAAELEILRRRRSGRSPDLPVLRMGHLSRSSDCTPALRHPIG